LGRSGSLPVTLTGGSPSSPTPKTSLTSSGATSETTSPPTDESLDLGLRVAKDNGAARRWKLYGKKGGVRSVGIRGGLTGRAVDALFIDDPISNLEQAYSATYREQAWGFWQLVGITRLAPGAPVILVLTRWHADDLAGRLLAGEDADLWTVLNIPGEAVENDPLGRKPGEWLESARQLTPQQWE